MPIFFHLEKPVRTTVGKLIMALSCREGREWKFLTVSLKLLILETLHDLPFMQIMYITGLVFMPHQLAKRRIINKRKTRDLQLN